MILHNTLFKLIRLIWYEADALEVGMVGHILFIIISELTLRNKRGQHGRRVGVTDQPPGGQILLQLQRKQVSTTSYNTKSRRI